MTLISSIAGCLFYFFSWTITEDHAFSISLDQKVESWALEQSPTLVCHALINWLKIASIFFQFGTQFLTFFQFVAISYTLYLRKLGSTF